MFAITGQANAALIGFVDNPETNSVDWANYVAAAGGQINDNVNFDSHTTGVLQSDFYATTDGVTLIADGDVNTVAYGSGPGQGNTSTEPLSTGEGSHIASNYLLDGGSASSLTISFDEQVMAAGLFIIDYYNPFGSNPLTIEAFTGANGTGTSLGSFSSQAYNFQPDQMYFMGLFSTDSNIGSIVFTDVNNTTGDITGIDNILFATSDSQETSTVPEPATLILFGTGLLGIVGTTRKKLL
jgi:hypothetical protein